MLESFASHLYGKELLHRTDNKNTEIVLLVGSRKSWLNTRGQCLSINYAGSTIFGCLSNELAETKMRLLIPCQEWMTLMTICLIQLALRLSITGGAPMQWTGLPASHLDKLLDIAVDTLILAARLLIPSQFPGKVKTTGLFLPHTLCLGFYVICQWEWKMAHYWFPIGHRPLGGYYLLRDRAIGGVLSKMSLNCNCMKVYSSRCRQQAVYFLPASHHLRFCAEVVFLWRQSLARVQTKWLQQKN